MQFDIFNDRQFFVYYESHNFCCCLVICLNKPYESKNPTIKIWIFYFWGPAPLSHPKKKMDIIFAQIEKVTN